MLAQKNRLKQRKDFALIKQQGRGCYNELFKLKSRPNSLDQSRFAVIISAKISKKAVVRNRLKRQCVEIIRLNLEQIVIGRDVLIWPQTRAIGLAYKQLETRLLNLFKQARLV